MHASPGKDHERRDPVLRPVPAGEKRDGKTVHKMTMDVQELDREIAPGLDVKAWTFNVRIWARCCTVSWAMSSRLPWKITVRWGIRSTSTRAWFAR